MAAATDKNRIKDLLRPAKRSLSQMLRLVSPSSESFGPPRGLVSDMEFWQKSRKGTGRVQVMSWTARPGLEMTPKLPECPDAKLLDYFKTFGRERLAPISGHRLEGGRLYQLNALTPDDRIVHNLSLHKNAVAANFGPLLSTLRLPSAKKLSGNVTVVGEEFDSSYFHWMFLALGRLAYLTTHVPLSDFSFFALTETQSPIKREMLQLLGIPESKWISLQRFPHLKPDVLTLAPWCSVFDPFVARFLRDAFLPHARPKAAGAKRIYVSRLHTGTRHVLNEDEVLSFLAPLGFYRVFLERLSFVEQLTLFHQAEVVIGPHGAGFANTLFSQPGAKVIEFFNGSWWSPVFWQLSEAMGLRHYCLVGESPPSEASPNQSSSLTVPVSKLRELLRRSGLS